MWLHDQIRTSDLLPNVYENADGGKQDNGCHDNLHNILCSTFMFFHKKQ